MFLSTDIGCWTHRMSLEAFLLQFFGLSLRRIDFNSTLTSVCGRIHLWSHMILDFCMLGLLLLQIKFLYWLLICIFYFFLIQSWGIVHSNNLSTSSRLSTSLACSFWQQFLMIFCTAAMPVVTSFFHFWYY